MEKLAEPFSWIEQSAVPVVRGSPVSNSRFSIAARIYQKGCFHVFQQRNRHSPDADACLMCVHCITLHPVRKWCICISRSDACVFLAVMCAYLLICVLMARAVALPLAGVNNMTGYYSRVGGGFYFSCLSGGARQSMQHYAKYATAFPFVWACVELGLFFYHKVL